MWHDDVVVAVDIRVAYDGYGDLFDGLLLRLNKDCGHVLEYILAQYGLDYDVVVSVFVQLYHAEIIDVAVKVEVEVRHRVGRIVEHSFELFEVLSLAECHGYCLKVEVV